ncbi:uncharacterized protein FIBRA_00831 [Fibroporia radiculosa]|uniref:SRP9 domain-containing protein n=1 Tax=Fibroporia radiculosa TaxID=599839 RepID=J4I856_9APHY|nr:uncharacterized protein FIBRA_00831 [Fibroporia radiculosa]CCL98826.1 predicted protein [Fibroporia radiculosa]
MAPAVKFAIKGKAVARHGFSMRCRVSEEPDRTFSLAARHVDEVLQGGLAQAVRGDKRETEMVLPHSHSRSLCQFQTLARPEARYVLLRPHVTRRDIISRPCDISPSWSRAPYPSGPHAMVFIASWQEFQDAAEALYEKSPNTTRYCVKWRASEGKLVLKITDDTTCLKFKTFSSVFLNRFEALNLSLMQKMQNQRLRRNLPVPTEAERGATPVPEAVSSATPAGTTGVAGGGVKKKKPKKKK